MQSSHGITSLAVLFIPDWKTNLQDLLILLHVYIHIYIYLGMDGWMDRESRSLPFTRLIMRYGRKRERERWRKMMKVELSVPFLLDPASSCGFELTLSSIGLCGRERIHRDLPKRGNEGEGGKRERNEDKNFNQLGAAWTRAASIPSAGVDVTGKASIHAGFSCWCQRQNSLHCQFLSPQSLSCFVCPRTTSTTSSTTLHYK